MTIITFNSSKFNQFWGKKTSPSRTLTQMNVVYVTAHFKMIRVKVLVWSGCNVCVKGGSMKTVCVKLEYDEDGAI